MPGAAARAERDCAERIRGIFGADLGEAPKVLQAMAVWDDRAGHLRTIRIGPGAPASVTDRFVLGLSRARVDAILTTGRILREEPRVRHDLGDSGLRAWRAERLGEEEAVSIVLTRRADLDFAQPFFTDRRVIVVTPEASAHPLQRRAPASVEVVGRHASDLRETLAWLRRERGFGRVSVEAGPSTSVDLYRDPPVVGELMLSVYQEASLAEEARGETFLTFPELERSFPVAGAHRSECTREEESGRWNFRRFWLPGQR